MSEIVNEKIQAENTDTYEGISPAGYTYGGSPNRNTPFWVQSATEDTYIKDITFSEETSTTETKYKETATNNLGQTVSQTIVVPVGGGGGVTPDITATASVDETTGTPAVSVTKSGTDTNPNFDFAFSGIKGEKGEKGEKGDQGEQGPQGETGATGATGKTPDVHAYATIDDTTGTPKVNVSVSGPDYLPLISFAFSGLKGEKGEQGPAGSGGDTTVTAETSYSEDTEYGTIPEIEVTKTDENINLNFKDFNRHETIGNSGTDGKAVITIGNGKEGTIKAEKIATYLAPGTSKLKTLRTGVAFECDDGSAKSTADVSVPVSALTGLTGYTTSTRKYQADGNRINFENVKTLSNGTYSAQTEAAFRFGNSSNGASTTSDFVDLTVGTVSVPYYLGKPMSFDGEGNVNYLSPFDGKTIERTVALGTGGSGLSWTDTAWLNINYWGVSESVKQGDTIKLNITVTSTDGNTTYAGVCYGVLGGLSDTAIQVATTPAVFVLTNNADITDQHLVIQSGTYINITYDTSASSWTGSYGLRELSTSSTSALNGCYFGVYADPVSTSSSGGSSVTVKKITIDMSDYTYSGPTSLGGGGALCTIKIYNADKSDYVMYTCTSPYFYSSSMNALYLSNTSVISSYSINGSLLKGELGFNATFQNPYTVGSNMVCSLQPDSTFVPSTAELTVNYYG